MTSADAAELANRREPLIAGGRTGEGTADVQSNRGVNQTSPSPCPNMPPRARIADSRPVYRTASRDFCTNQIPADIAEDRTEGRAYAPIRSLIAGLQLQILRKRVSGNEPWDLQVVPRALKAFICP